MRVVRGWGEAAMRVGVVRGAGDREEAAMRVGRVGQRAQMEWVGFGQAGMDCARNGGEGTISCQKLG